MKEAVTLHLVSESSSLIIKNLIGLVFQQFSNVETKKYVWTLIKTNYSLNKAMEKISKKPGIVFYHMADKELEKELILRCEELQISAISITNDLVDRVSKIIDITPSLEQEHHTLNEDYFDRIDDVDFSIKHDDGQSISTISQADIILVGLSRSSKTPTSMYLAFNGFKVANIPFINKDSLERYLLHMRGNLVIGLLVNPGRLMHIRESRIPNLGHESCSNYVDLNLIRDECRILKEICKEHNWPIIDVTSKSVEETAANVMKIYYDYNSMKSI